MTMGFKPAIHPNGNSFTYVSSYVPTKVYGKVSGARLKEAGVIVKYRNGRKKFIANKDVDLKELDRKIEGFLKK